MKRLSLQQPSFSDYWSTELPLKIYLLIMVGLLIATAQYAKADDSAWEYKVVILQGVTAGGTIEKDTSGIYVDTMRTRTLNILATDGWEVVAIIGAVATDHAVYLRRKSRK